MQALALVSYFKTITHAHQPRLVLRDAAHVLLHGASHKGAADFMAGWAAGALRPLARWAQPLRLVRWAEGQPSARDVERALTTGLHDVAAAAAARRRLCPDLERRLQPAGGRPAGEQPAAEAAGEEAAEAVPVRVVALNRFCWEAEVRPGESAAAAAAAVAALLPSRAGEGAIEAGEEVQMATALPVWLLPHELGSCEGALAAVAAAMPMPAFGMEVVAPALASCDSLQQLAAAHARALQALQPHGPYVLAGCGVFGSLLAFATACELERGGASEPQQVLLLLIDGPAAPLGSGSSSSGSSAGNGSGCSSQQLLVLPDPRAYALYYTLAAAGALARPVPPLATFVRELASALGCGDGAELGALGSAELAAGTAVAFPAPPGAAVTAAEGGWRSRLEAAVQLGAAMAQLVGSYSPEYVLLGPALLLLPEDEAGAAFVEVARESCSGPLALMSLPTECGGHAQVLALGLDSWRCVAAAAMDAILEQLPQL